MVDKTPGDRKLSVPNKTLTLKPRVETGTVKQSFSHGRTKQVVVEKRGKRRVGGEDACARADRNQVSASRACKGAARPPGNPGRATRRFGRGAAYPDRGRA
jgi:translation initiation factor IF-2